ncbi:MAG TPA: nucleotidyltransferase domain-containing protein [Candidatus Omnitrophota bacterium]|nr:nucleotidyltransferase domain-containing protein [Candidatus Omnitrophota bacterium]
MSEKKIREIISFIKKFFKKNKIDKVVIFGSCVKGHFTADSDVDVAIVSRDFEKKDIFQRAKMLSGLNWALVGQFMLPFDIVPISLEEWNKSSSLVVGFAREGRSF